MVDTQNSGNSKSLNKNGDDNKKVHKLLYDQSKNAPSERATVGVKKYNKKIRQREHVH